MTPSDLIFLVSVLFVLTMGVRIAVSALRRRWQTTRRLGRILAWFLAFYAVLLICVALARPRRFYAPARRRCYDDWCVTAMEAKIAGASTPVPCQTDQDGRNWIATIEVSSVARRIRQRARDARAELEDRQGRRYQPCGPPLARGTGPARSLSDPLGPGESFSVFLPFRLPPGQTPAGLVLHHGDFPGIVIIGADHSLLHPPALQPFGKEQPER